MPFIRQTLESILSLQGIICDDKEILYDTLALYEENNIDLTDSMVIAQMRYSGVKEIFTYDKDFDNQENIIRCFHQLVISKQNLVPDYDNPLTHDSPTLTQPSPAPGRGSVGTHAQQTLPSSFHLTFPRPFGG